ncbi:hypothetical protein COT50_01865 [candidate division WWE3 bacterium CG08_land_8_20_14_0_20_41_10]|uniref:Homing endonuclease LAGLIDADG domain-containing protein n=1 Tax=candidate division WWE3 bacterium CG08_land_8_20_14_0_20_41_10 TaxID=1975085 RepID=A0A2H0XC20_UNCKA|nr:MAG: hypothetical protein COT50_01865 [candidate division WWE3 bacterium CG08_land_8_20_14_0_20_41_10]
MANNGETPQWAIPWEVESSIIACMNKVQKVVLVGMIMGDAYIQPTGAKNARIRLEHSLKQYDYLMWKAKFFPEFFQGRPTTLNRFNQKYGKTYSYCRFQSNSSPEIGAFRRIFYDDHGKKVIPENMVELLHHPLSLCVWYLDDGYYYKKDKMSYIYLPNYSSKEFDFLTLVMTKNFNLSPKLKRKKLGWCLLFSVLQTRELIKLISPFVPDCMKYKIGL